MNGILKLKNEIIKTIDTAFQSAFRQGLLTAVPLPTITVERTKDSQNGEYACSIALKVASAMGMKAIEVAKVLAENIGQNPAFDVEAAHPGFLNFLVKNAWLQNSIVEALESAENFGKLDKYNGQRVQIEFVSANPTGPLHVGHGRGAVLGSTLGNVLHEAGYEVWREFYINDAGNQIATFKHSLFARYMQELGIPDIEMPADGYLGTYLIQLARDIREEYGHQFEKDAEALCRVGLLKMLSDIKSDLAEIDVRFDHWFSEQSLFDSGEYQTTVNELQNKGYLAYRDGALWFVSSRSGEEKDNVIIRSDGTPTYFATDIAYHRNKFLNRGFNRVIDIWGADHQGHVSRMKAVLQALDIDPNRLTILIGQMVTIKRGGELVKLSKRGGTLVTLREVVSEVGKDAVRFAFISRSADSQMDFDLELAQKQSAENPVYYVQYAFARICSILRKASEENLDFEHGDVRLLSDPNEKELMKKIITLPAIIELAAEELAPHHLAYYASDLATSFHAFYKNCRVLNNQEKELDRARLLLCSAAQLALRRTLTILGLGTPEKM